MVKGAFSDCLHVKAGWGAVLRYVLMVISIGLCVPILEWCFTSQTIPHFLMQWGFSAVYAGSISLMLWTSMPYVWIRTIAWGLFARWAARGALVVFAAALGCLIGGYFVVLVLPAANGSFWADFIASFRLSLLISAVTVAFTGAYETMQHKLQKSEVQLKTKELERERALKLATEAQLASLQSRIHPHFLFNTINSISSLIHEDPERAEKLLTQMAALLRFSLDSSQNRLVPLELELRIVRDYLDIESARFGLRLRHEISVPSDLLGLPVPPLALQTLIENSVKYAVNARRHGADVRVTAAKDGHRAYLEVSDDGPGFSTLALPAGHGLSNLQQRLQGLFGDHAGLEVSSQPGRTAVRLSIPLGVTEQKAAV